MTIEKEQGIVTSKRSCLLILAELDERVKCQFSSSPDKEGGIFLVKLQSELSMAILSVRTLPKASVNSVIGDYHWRTSFMNQSRRVLLYLDFCL